MKNKIFKVWNKFIDNGVRPEHSFEEIKRIRVINQSNIMGFLISVSYSLILFSLTFHDIIHLNVDFGFVFDICFLLTIALLCFISSLLIKKFGYKVGGVFILTTFPALMVVLSLFFGKGGTEYYFFPFFILLFYILRNRGELIILTIYLIMLFVLSHYLEDNVLIPRIASTKTGFFFYVNIISAFISSYVFLNLFITEFEKKQKEIESKNTELKIAVDIANQKSEEIKLLLKELSHRTKNNLQLVSSIINIQSGKITDATAKSTIDDTRDRIFAMALLHQKLYVNNNLNTFSLSDYALDLINYLINIFDDKSNQVKIITDIDKIEMKIDNAIHIGLVINEILTNSFKHGMNRGREKFIKVCVKKIEEQNIVISISDSGEGIKQIAQNNYSQSFGGSLIYSLVKQMEGEISFNEKDKNEIIIRLKNIL